MSQALCIVHIFYRLEQFSDLIAQYNFPNEFLAYENFNVFENFVCNFQITDYFFDQMGYSR